MPELLGEQTLDFSAGQDSSRGSRIISENGYYKGINVSVASGSLKPRWGFDRCSLTFEEGYILDDSLRRRTYKDIFEGGKFQALESITMGDVPYLLTVISGCIFLINLQSMKVSYLERSDGGRLSGRAPRINSTVTDKYVIFYDYPDYPTIVNGVSARRANPDNYEIPASRLGAFNQSRLFIGNETNEFTGGDPIGNTVAIEPPITFEEVLSAGDYYNQVFQVTTEVKGEPITAMTTLQAVDTSTGVGPLIVATPSGIYAYATHVPRAQWGAGSFGSKIISKYGIVGPKAVENVNADMFFVSSDGHLRSFSMSQEDQRKWSNLPLSRGVSNWLKVSDPELLTYSRIMYFNNKLFFTVNPFRVPVTDLASGFPITDYAFGGMVVMEMDTLGASGSGDSPAWAGLWTGIKPMDFASSGSRMFAFAKDSTSINSLYEVNPDLKYDQADSTIRPIRSRVYSRRYGFGSPFNIKKMHSIEFNLENVKGDFEMDIHYRPSHSPYYYLWRSFRHNAPWRMDNFIAEGLIGESDGHSFRDMIVGDSETDEVNPISDEFINVFKELQLCLTVQGIDWEISGYRVKAIENASTYTESSPLLYKDNIILNKDDFTDEDWTYKDFKTCQKTLT